MGNQPHRRLLRRLAPVMVVASLALVGFGCQPPPACGDGLDNDRDGLVDADDPGCTERKDTSELGTADCDDAIDDDRDGRLDWSADADAAGDPGCTSLTDPSELGTAQCDDGRDNDGDGRRDYSTIRRSDLQCESHTDDLERLPECSDGQDNDGDSYYDFGDGQVVNGSEIAAGDPGCSSTSDDSEAPVNPPRQCGDGIDNDGDGAIDRADPGCSWQYDDTEAVTEGGIEFCENGIDDDGDGLFDEAGCVPA